jgi:WD40 repeat protein
VTPLLMRQASKRLLRRSLRAHIREVDGMSSERLLTIEYCPSLPRPSDGGRENVPDWVGSLCGLQGGAGGMFVGGCYDGCIRLFDGDATLTNETAAHEGAVKAVVGLGDIVVSGGQDKSVRTWRLSGGTLIPVCQNIYSSSELLIFFPAQMKGWRERSRRLFSLDP